MGQANFALFKTIYHLVFDGLIYCLVTLLLKNIIAVVGRQSLKYIE